ncbi:MAG: DNA cytosine methyltransferase [Christensenellales bacterium]|jgi:DNA (cytosine-5)-methyltransferase 1
MVIKAVDLFCGVGGLTCGLRKAGISVVAGIDLDATCEYAYTENNGSVFINKSIADVAGQEIKNLLVGAETTVLVGCAPCQPFSSHRKDKQNRSNHKDWHLLNQFGRLVKEVHPSIVSMENVPELIKERVYTDFVSLLKSEGYYVSSSVVNAADYGVPQRRRRLILLASLANEISLVPSTHSKHLTVRGAIGNLPHVRAGSQNTSDRLHVAPSLSDINLKRIQHSVPGGTWREWPENLKLACHKTEKGRSYASVYGRMEWDAPSPTITTQYIGYGTGRFGHPEQDRALTIREGAIIQSFPPSYTFVRDDKPVSIRNIAKHIGNAVPPRLAEVIGHSILKHLEEQTHVGGNCNE